MGQLLNREGLKKWILRKLGAPIIKIELTEAHLDDSVEEASRWFAAKKGVEKIGEVVTITGISKYALPDDVDFLYEVVFSEPTFDLASVFYPTMGLLDGQIPFNLYATASLGIASDYVQVLQYLDTLKRVAGSEPEWIQEGTSLTILPIPTRGGKIVFRYNTHKIPEIDQLSERDHDLVKRYSLADAKEILGRVRSKYGEYPTAQGSVSLDGDKLLDEAAQAKEALEEEISMSGYPMMFITG